MIMFVKKHIWLLVLVLMLIVTPFSLSSQSEFTVRVLITGLAVDKEEGEYSLAAQVIIPGDGGQGSENIEIVEAKAKSIAEGVEKLATKLGKTVGIAHLDYVIVGSTMLESDDIGAALDFITRNKIISNAIPVFCCEGKATELLQKTKDIPTGTAVNLLKVFYFKTRMSNGIIPSIYEFINDNLTISQTGLLSGLEIETSKSESSGGGSGEGGSTSQSGSEMSGEQKSSGGEIPKFRDDNDIYVFKAKKFMTKITDYEHKQGIYLMNPRSREMILSVEDVNGDIYKNALVAIKLREKKLKVVPKFEEGKPIVTIKISFENNTVLEITSDEQDEKFYYADKIYMDDIILDAVEEKIKKCINDVFELTKEDADIFSLEDEFYKRQTKKYKEYKKSNPTDFAKDIELRFEIELKRRV